MVGRIALVLVGIAAFAGGCSSSKSEEPAPVPPAADPDCKVTDAPALGACNASDVSFTAMVDAGDAGDGGDAGLVADSSTDAGVDPPEAGAAALASCAIGSAHVVACRESSAVNAAAGNDGNAFVVIVGRAHADLVTLAAPTPVIEPLPETYAYGDTATLLATKEGEPFVVSSRGSSVYSQLRTAPAAQVAGVKTSGFGPRAWNAAGAIAVSLNGAALPQGLVRRADGTIAVEDGPAVVQDEHRFIGLTDDGKLFSVGLGAQSYGGVSLGGALTFAFPSARLRVSPSTPANVPPIVALENSWLDVGVWDAGTNAYGLARVAPGIALCARNDDCTNTCGEGGTEASPGAFAVTRDRDGTILVVYLRRELTRQRRYRRASGGLCDRIDCACGSEMENEHVTRAEIVILQVDDVARAVRERFVLALPPSDANKVGFDVGVFGVPQLDAQLRDGHLLLTFTGLAANNTQSMSLYDVRVR